MFSTKLSLQLPFRYNTLSGRFLLPYHTAMLILYRTADQPAYTCLRSTVGCGGGAARRG